jgi:hypothetical protein
MIVAFHYRIKSPFLMAIFCLAFLLLSIRLEPKTCNAVESKGIYDSHFQYATDANWLDSFTYQEQSENHCTCFSQDKTCCKDKITSKRPKDPRLCLVCRDSQQKLSIVRETMTEPSLCSLQGQRDGKYDDFKSRNKSEVYLTNCSFLI